MSPVTTFAVGLAPGDRPLALHPTHPSAHAGLQLIVGGDSVDVAIGFMHRSVEKIVESRDYRQAIMVANRHDWTSAFTSELGLAVTLERMLGIRVPPRAAHIRTMLAEVSRLNAALHFLAPSLPDIHRPALRARESLLDGIEAVTGQRIHTMFVRIGGIAHDITDAEIDLINAGIDQAASILPDLTGKIMDWSSTFAGVGVLPASAAESCGVSGPVGRACGIDLDARFVDPYDAYPLDDRLPIYSDSDVPSRFAAMCDSAAQSVRIARSLLGALPDGDIDVPLPKVIKAPESTGIGAAESAIGTNRYFVVSRGAKNPHRIAIRSASFGNASALRFAIDSTDPAALAATVMSFFLVGGDIDR